MVSPFWSVAQSLSLDPTHPPSPQKLSSFIYILPDAAESWKLEEVLQQKGEFVLLDEYILEGKKGDINWAWISFHNETLLPQEWVLQEAHETRMQAYVLSGDQLLSKTRAGQLVPLSEESLPAGKSWEARIYFRLMPGQQKHILIRSQNDFGFQQVFDFQILRFDQYQSNIGNRNLYQMLFQGALWILLLYHITLFFVVRDKSYLFYCLYIASVSLFYLYFFGFSKEWFFPNQPQWDLVGTLLPILPPVFLLLFLRHTFHREPNVQWQSQSRFLAWSSLGILACGYILLYLDQAIWAFRIQNIFTLLIYGLILRMLIPLLKDSRIFVRLFLFGTLLLLGLAATSIGLFFISENTAGILVQFGILAQILIYATGLGYQYQNTIHIQQTAKDQLIDQLKQQRMLETHINQELADMVKMRTSILEEQKQMLNLAREKARKAEDFRHHLSDMAQHAIRTPMHVILGLSSLLPEESDEEEKKEMLEQVAQSSRDLVHQVNNILELGKLETENFHLAEAPFQLHDLIKNIGATLRNLLPESRPSFRVQYKSDIPDVLIGPFPQLKQLLLGLLQDIQSQSPEQTLLSLMVEQLDQKSERVLLRFELPAWSSEDALPTGLKNAERLLDWMGASWKQNEDSFRFELWLKALPDNLDQNQDILPGKNILLVEDNPLNQKVALGFLQRWGVKVSLAENGQEALEKVQQHTFDAILMDLKMPQMDGFTAARLIHQLPDYVAPPIIALSATTITESITKARQAGMKHFIAKPFNPKELQDTLRKILR